MPGRFQACAWLAVFMQRAAALLLTQLIELRLDRAVEDGCPHRKGCPLQPEAALCRNETQYHGKCIRATAPLPPSRSKPQNPRNAQSSPIAAGGFPQSAELQSLWAECSESLLFCQDSCGLGVSRGRSGSPRTRTNM